MTGDHSAAAVGCASCGTPCNSLRTYGSPRGDYSLCVRCCDWPRPAVTVADVRPPPKKKRR
jgi:hypothetical protein